MLYNFGNEDLLFVLGERDDKDILFLPNKKNSYSVKVDSDDSFVEKEFNQIPEHICSLFDRDYQNFLDFLDSKEITYQIKFGVLSYWN